MRIAEICDKGPYEVWGNAHEAIELDVNEEDHIVGYLEEEDRDEFDYHILDYPNLIKFKKDDKYDYECWDYSEGLHEIDWTVPVTPKGPWFLVLDTVRKHNKRVITVELRKL